MIKKKEIQHKMIIDLDGPDGNVFTLISIAKNLMDIIDKSRTSKIKTEMMSSDYYHAIYVFEREFGAFVILETTNDEILKIIA